MSERLQKVLARAGLGSRREIEGWISDGRIQVNGVVAVLGCTGDGTEAISIDGKSVTLAPPQAQRVIAYHKPMGEITTRSDPEGRPTIFDHLPRLAAGRWISVGRLDINTSGLLLLTNDGELANRLMYPSTQLEREYAVRVFGEIDGLILERLLHGVELEDGPARFISIRDAGGSGANRWYHVVLAEGRNREVRRLWESQGVQVSRLTRVRYGPIELGRRLPVESWRDLEAGELAALRNAAGMPASAPRQAVKAPPRSKPGAKPSAKPNDKPTTRTSAKPGVRSKAKTTTSSRKSPPRQRRS